jgi:putative DNA primase/helicase
MTDHKSNSDLGADAIAHDEDAKLKRLASLNPLRYARERKAAAEELGISLAALDKAVKDFKATDSDTKGQGRALELPETDPWPQTVDGADLLTDICAAIRRYLVLPSGSAEILALWAVHTHAFDCFAHSPRLAITSPEKGCGKTTALDVVRELVARALPTSNATVSAVFRAVEIARPTLLIDEADTFLKENDELRGILNAGHSKGGMILRTVGDDHEPRQFSTWAPAAIAMIGRLPDTLEDRAITVRLRRRRPTEKVEAFRSDRVTELRELARKAARWAADNRVALAASDPATGRLFNRAADNWRPLLAIADIAGGDWPRFARFVAEGAESMKQDQSVRAMLLKDIREIFVQRPFSDRISSTELVVLLGAMEGRPWSEWRHGKPMTAAGLARLLGPFGITPGTKRDGDVTFKGYLVSDFADAFASYLPDQTVTPSQPNSSGQCDVLQGVTQERDVTVSKASQPNNDGHCDGVTLPDPDGWSFNLDDLDRSPAETRN